MVKGLQVTGLSSIRRLEVGGGRGLYVGADLEICPKELLQHVRVVGEWWEWGWRRHCDGRGLHADTHTPIIMYEVEPLVLNQTMLAHEEGYPRILTKYVRAYGVPVQHMCGCV